METSSGSAPQVTRDMMAIRSRVSAVAFTERSQPPRLMLSSLAACREFHGSLTLTSRAIRSNCHWMRPMSSSPITPSLGMVPL